MRVIEPALTYERLIVELLEKAGKTLFTGEAMYVYLKLIASLTGEDDIDKIATTLMRQTYEHVKERRDKERAIVESNVLYGLKALKKISSILQKRGYISKGEIAIFTKKFEVE